MAFGQISPAHLEGEALRRWYLRSPDEIEQEGRRAAEQAYKAFFGRSGGGQAEPEAAEPVSREPPPTAVSDRRTGLESDGLRNSFPKPQSEWIAATRSPPYHGRRAVTGSVRGATETASHLHLHLHLHRHSIRRLVDRVALRAVADRRVRIRSSAPCSTRTILKFADGSRAWTPADAVGKARQDARRIASAPKERWDIPL